jgi:histidinol dehydrogenase
VIPRIDLRGPLPRDLRTVLPRAPLDVEAALEQVRPICADVRHRGAAAIREHTARFDGVTLHRPRVPEAAIDQAVAALDPGVRAALEECMRRVRAVHRAQRRSDVTTPVVPGGTVTERWVPVGRVGLYVPGGQAVYPSSVVMNVVPAQEAGVDSIAVASPPQRDSTGRPHPLVLAACGLLGVREVYAVGGAQAIAMFAYGYGADGTEAVDAVDAADAGEIADATDGGGPVEYCRPVDMVTGPGNVWVTAAKRLLKGQIGIDAEAGPTEIAILADDTADPVHVAADLISQAEHDALAAAVLVTASPALAEAVERELPVALARTKHVERIRTALTGPQSGIVLVDDIDAGLRVVDAYAAEHLEVQTRDARAVAARVRNAGAVFVGPHSPVSLGDYLAGSNHVLPTGGCACHSGGLSVQTFLRGIHVVDYDRRALSAAADMVRTLADAEDLPAHGAAVDARFPGSDAP